MFLATEKVWHFWIAVPMAASAILLVLSLIALYVAKVSRTRFPNSHS